MCIRDSVWSGATIGLSVFSSIVRKMAFSVVSLFSNECLDVYKRQGFGQVRVAVYGALAVFYL